MTEFISNHTGLFSILAIVFTIVMGLIVGWSDFVKSELRKAQKK